MKKEMADALLDFYQKILKPEFEGIHQKLAEHDERFAEVFGHFEELYRRMDRTEDELLAIINRLDRLEARMDQLEGRMDRLENAMTERNENRAELEKRVKEMKAELALLQNRLKIVEQQLNQHQEQS